MKRWATTGGSAAWAAAFSHGSCGRARACACACDVAGHGSVWARVFGGGVCHLSSAVGSDLDSGRHEGGRTEEWPGAREGGWEVGETIAVQRMRGTRGTSEEGCGCSGHVDGYTDGVAGR